MSCTQILARAGARASVRAADGDPKITVSLASVFIEFFCFVFSRILLQSIILRGKFQRKFEAVLLK